MVAACFLCGEEIESRTQKAKKLLLFDRAGKKYLTVLNDLTEESFGSPLFGEDEAGNDRDKTYICHSCCSIVDKLLSLRKKAEEEKSKVLQKLESLMNSEPQQQSTPRTSRKRSISARESRAKLTVPYGPYEKTYLLSPFSEENSKRMARRSYNALSTSLLESERTGNIFLLQLIQQIKKEIKHICSTTHDSILRDTYEGVQQFSWETVTNELCKNVPTLMTIISKLTLGDERLACMIVSMILKKRLPKMGLVQRAMSLLLYGNGTNIQVYNCLQPLMICLSHGGTIKLLDRLSKEHDLKVLFWSDNLVPHLESQSENIPVIQKYATSVTDVSQVNSRDITAEEENEDEFPLESMTEELIVDLACSEAEDGSGDEEIEMDDDETLDISSKSCSSTLPIEEISLSSSNVPSIHDSTQTLVVEDSNISRWQGFKIVGDNIDKNFRPSYQRIHSQTISFHFFHSFAVLDRIDLSGMSNISNVGIVDVAKLLPSQEDVSITKHHFSVFISRILVQKMSEFAHDRDSVVWHIPHRRQAEMSMKSEVVPLGVNLHNENKVDEMSRIMDELHKYVPARDVHDRITLPNGETEEETTDKLHQVLFGGDQLTVAKARSAIGMRRTHDTNREKLQGLIPVVEDWHARVTLLQVLFKRLMKESSGRQRGTLMQLKNLIKATSIPKDPKQNVKATEDFLSKVMAGYVIAAAKGILRTSDGTLTVHEVSEKIVDQYVRLLSVPTDTDKSDAVLTYTSELITLTLLWEDFHDATREGDGDRIMMLWKFLLIVFDAGNRYNYRKEAIILLLQYHYFFSPLKAEQLAYGRFINTHGRIGCNISSDLHLEHLNRRLKGVLRNLQSNIQTNTIVRAAKSIGIVQQICDQFDRETANRKQGSDKHTVPSSRKDVALIVDSLEEEPSVLMNKPNRDHSSFKLRDSILEDFNKESITDKIIHFVGVFL